jgi:hypothetical protein
MNSVEDNQITALAIGFGFLNKLEQKVTIQVSRHRRGEPYQQVTIAP